MCDEYKCLTWTECNITCPSCKITGGAQYLTHAFDCELAKHFFGKRSYYEQNNKSRIVTDSNYSKGIINAMYYLPSKKIEVGTGKACDSVKISSKHEPLKKCLLCEKYGTLSKHYRICQLEKHLFGKPITSQTKSLKYNNSILKQSLTKRMLNNEHYTKRLESKRRGIKQ